MTKPSESTSSTILTRRLRPIVGKATLTLFTFILLVAFLSPFAYMFATATKDREQISQVRPLWPAKEETFTYTGETKTVTFGDEEITLESGAEYDIYFVPTEDGGERRLAMVAPRRQVSYFIDPSNPEAGVFEWEGVWRKLDRAWTFEIQLDNFVRAWNELNFPLIVRNTLIIAVGGMIGTLISSILVAYGFSRFRIPGKSIFFIILVGTIILPRQVTLIPTYALFARIGWVGTFLPLIVPHFFANAYNVFLLRQYFMTIPKEMDEAAMIDGASPMRTLLSIILPQAMPAVVTVGLFHFVFAWNDYFTPLIYLSAKRDLQPISVAIQLYNARYAFEVNMIQATALLGLAVPLIIFFFAQRVFMRGVVTTGVEK